jgi:hypothetical protein
LRGCPKAAAFSLVLIISQVNCLGAASGSRICSFVGLGFVAHLFEDALVFDPAYPSFGQ